MAARGVTTARRRALVVEDEPIMATLLSSVLETGGFESRMCRTAREARNAIDKFDPDAALIDVTLGRGPTGIDLAHYLRIAHPGIAVLLLTKHADLRATGHSLKDVPAGCRLLHKESIADVNELYAALESLLDDQPAGPQEYSTGPLARLTSRQLGVLRMVAQGYTSQEIGRRRGTSRAAVEKMLTSIYQTLGLEAGGDLSPRAEAMRIFIANAGVPDRHDAD